MKNELKLNGHGLEEALLQTARQTAGSAQFSPSCERSLRVWITIGIQRMERQRRLDPRVQHDRRGRDVQRDLPIGR